MALYSVAMVAPLSYLVGDRVKPARRIRILSSPVYVAGQVIRQPLRLSGTLRLGTWVRKGTLIVFTISVMSRLKAPEIFFDQ